MKPVLVFALLLGGALAGAPALAQHSTSGTIAPPAGGAASAMALAVPALAPAPTTAASPAAPVAAAMPPAASAAGTPAAGTPAAGAPGRPPLMALPAPQPVALAAPPSTAASLMQTVVALLFVLGLLAALAWFLKRFAPRAGLGQRNVKLVGALSVGARERILVVEVADQWIVVGASPGRMNALATLPRQPQPQDEEAPVAAGASFAEWFKQTIDKRNGK